MSRRFGWGPTFWRAFVGAIPGMSRRFGWGPTFWRAFVGAIPGMSRRFGGADADWPNQKGRASISARAARANHPRSTAMEAMTAIRRMASLPSVRTSMALSTATCAK